MGLIVVTPEEFFNIILEGRRTTDMKIGIREPRSSAVARAGKCVLAKPGQSEAPTKSLGAHPSRLRRRRMDRPARSNNCSSPTLRQPAWADKFGLTKADSGNLSRMATCLHHSRELARDATPRALKRNLDEREEITRRTRPAPIGPPGLGWAPTLPYEAPTMGPAIHQPATRT